MCLSLCVLDVHACTLCTDLWFIIIHVIVSCNYFIILYIVQKHSLGCMVCSLIHSVHSSEFLMRFEAWAKLAQQWLVCAPLGIHLKPINKELMLLVTI